MITPRTAWMTRGTLLILTLLLPFTATANVREDSQDVQRLCIGLLWCTEQSAGGTSVDGLLWLYSSEERGSYTRLAIRPIYSMEEDPTRNLLRRSFLWPLGTYERRGDTAWTHVFPLYWHSERPGQEWTFTTIPLYLKSIDGDSASHHLFPLFGRHVVGEYYASYSVLGPLLMTTSDTRTDLAQWDLLFPLFHYRHDLNASNSWFAPLYWSGEDISKGEAYRYLLPLYGSSDSPTQHYHFLFPLYGYADNVPAQVRRVALLGLPPAKGFPGMPSLSLFEHVTTANEISHRVFPLYRYATSGTSTSTFDALLLYRHHTDPAETVDRFLPFYAYEANLLTQTHEFDVFGYRELSWFRHQTDPNLTQSRLLGIYNYDGSRDGALQVSALGYRRGSLFFHRAQNDLTENRVFPLHDYFRHGDTSTLSLLGMSEVALFRQETTSTLTRQRLFPLYRYRHDRAQDETEFDAAFLYRHLTSPTQVADRLLPFWDYAGATAKNDWRFSLLGIDALALYRHDVDDAHTLDHLFPLYGYRSEPDSGTRFSALGLPPIGRISAWSLYEHDQSPALVGDRFFPLYRYRHNENRQESSFDMLGMGAASLVHHESAPTLVANHVFPLYRYAHDEEATETTVNVLGIEPVSLFRSQSSPLHHDHHLFPLYGYHQAGEIQRFSAVGLPAIGGIPALSFYAHNATAASLHDRLFPLYSYRSDDTTDTRSFSALWMFWRTTSPTLSKTSLFPIASFSNDKAAGQQTVSILGFEPALPVSWIQHSWGDQQDRGLFFPLYDYRREGDRDSLSVGGLSYIALYRQEHSPTVRSHRLFPIYSHSHDLEHDVVDTNILLAYQRMRTPSRSTDTLVPLWHYEGTDDQTESRFNALGIGSFSLYEHHADAAGTTNRFVPLYKYASNHETGDAEFSLLWPLADYNSRQGVVTSASVLWWLASYERPDETHTQFHLLGGSKMAMLRRTTSPTESIFEINPVIPLYRYRHGTDGGTSWDLFYGLIGMESTQERIGAKLFWITL